MRKTSLLLLCALLLLSIVTPVSASAGTSMGDQVVETAQKYLGTPYRYGSSEYTTATFDCSSYTKRVFGEKGIWLPRTSSDQFRQGVPVARDNLKVGDLLFYTTNGKGTVSHVGIYTGGGKMVSASSSKGVSYADAFSSSYWGPRYLGARRVIKETTVTVAAVPTAKANVTIDGEAKTFSTTPIIKKGTTLVPMKDLFESLGAEVYWNEEQRIATGVKGNTIVDIQIDDLWVTINGQAITLDQSVEIMDGRTMIPLKVVSEAFGSEVKWDPSTYTVHILTDTQST